MASLNNDYIDLYIYLLVINCYTYGFFIRPTHIIDAKSITYTFKPIYTPLGVISP